jgi:hypothetical protein
LIPYKSIFIKAFRKRQEKILTFWLPSRSVFRGRNGGPPGVTTRSDVRPLAGEIEGLTMMKESGIFEVFNMVNE